MISDRRLYLAADGLTVVEHGDERAASVLVGKGCEIEDGEARRLGVVIPAAPRPEIYTPEELLEEYGSGEPAEDLSPAPSPTPSEATAPARPKPRGKS